MVAGPAAQRFVLGVEQGFGFVTTLADMHTRQRAGKQFVTVHDAESLMRPVYLQPTDTAIAVLTEKNRFSVVDQDELRMLKTGSRGTIPVIHDKADPLLQWAVGGQQGEEVGG